MSLKLLLTIFNKNKQTNVSFYDVNHIILFGLVLNLYQLFRYTKVHLKGGLKMEIFFNSIRNVFFGFIVLVINIPIFWSFNGAVEFLKSAARALGLEI